MTESTVVVERIDPAVALVRFNRPERLNAFDDASLERLHAQLGAFAADPTLRAVIFTGAGRAFSAGADLKAMQARTQAETPVRQAVAGLQLYQDVTRRMVDSPVVFIAALNGIAVGIGAELALAADIRIGSPAAEFMLTEAKRGLFQTNGVMHFLPRVVGHGRAAQWLLTGERVGADRLLEAGFLTEIVSGDLLERARELALTVAGNAPISVRLIKRLLRRTWEVDLEAMLQYEIDGMLACMSSDDIEEGLRAFFEKRPPRWQGR
ncbi:MAG: enoyl-CoA hydratase/isomerase family protein [Gemmatimonadales bacterium]